MKKNMGTLDRTIRMLITAIIVYLYATSMIGGTLAAVLLVVAAVFTLTSILAFCPIYTLLGLSSCPKETGKTAK